MFDIRGRFRIKHATQYHEKHRFTHDFRTRSGPVYQTRYPISNEKGRKRESHAREKG